jgi:F-type H+-transporting ATPase subunit delta
LADASTPIASEAARRYARALFDLAQDRGQLARIHADFADFAGQVRASRALSSFLASPVFSRDQKVGALSDLARAAELDGLVANFLAVMARNGRAGEIGSTQRAFDTLYANQRGVKRAIARTAQPMTDAQRMRVEGVLAKSVGGEVELSEEVDEGLIGGLQLLIGSKRVDASLAAKLERMNTAMKGG